MKVSGLVLFVIKGRIEKTPHNPRDIPVTLSESKQETRARKKQTRVYHIP